ncbi:hypothetical protein IFR05_005928 [Cadophora sp. M221]|nr:hypothetical protein IFR05_005928 [Cadophora sp. M221]
MFAAWRQWAVEEGLGGMDIIETRWGEGSDKGPDSWEGYPPDAVNEFAPHAGGRDQATFSSLKRMARVYHRGTLEPSAQFGDGYGVAMKNALQISEKDHVWADISNGLSFVRDQEIAAVMERKADACVLIRASPENAEDKVFKLSAMLRSLQAQHNQNWRAVVFQSDRAFFPQLPVLVTRALDARIKHVEVSKDVVIPIPEGDDTSFLATDWVIKDLATSSPGCASAKYFLITDGSNTYEPSAFDSLSKSQDLIGLNVESRQHIWDHPQLQSKSWESRCSHLQESGLNICSASTPTLATFDLSATFFSLGKFQAENHSFDRVFHDFPRPQAGGFAEYLINERKWSFAPPSKGDECHVRHNPAYSSCLRTGNFWFDSPDFNEMGCYSTTNLMRLFEKTSPLLEVLDLEFFRKNGYCIRYKQEAYARKLASSGSV